MQTSLIQKSILSVFTGIVLLFPCEGISQVNQVTKGLSTNGIYAKITVIWNTNKSQSPEIIVSAIDSNADQIFGEGHLGTNWFKAFANENWQYFEATNSFCGPIELRDAHGQTIPLSKLAISSPKAYPNKYSLSEEWKRHFPPNPHRYSFGQTVFPLPLIRNVSELAKFQLLDYFEIKQAGEYELTVWPKIYKRTSTNGDICERIDIPPVAVSVKWTGN